MSRLTLITAPIIGSKDELSDAFNEWTWANLIGSVALVGPEYRHLGLDVPAHWHNNNQVEVIVLRELLMLERFSTVAIASIRSCELYELTDERLADEVRLLDLVRSLFNYSKESTKRVKGVTVGIADPSDDCNDRHFDPRWDLHILHDSQQVIDSSVAVMPLEPEQRTTTCLLTALAVTGALILPKSESVALIDQIYDQAVGMTKPVRLVRVQMRVLDAGYYTDEILTGLFSQGIHWSVPSDIGGAEANEDNPVPSDFVQQLTRSINFEYSRYVSSRTDHTASARGFRSPMARILYGSTSVGGRKAMRLTEGIATVEQADDQRASKFSGDNRFNTKTLLPAAPSDSREQIDRLTSASEKTWKTIRSTTFGLVDGSTLPIGFDPPSNDVDRLLYTDPAMIGPPPDDNRFELPIDVIAELDFDRPKHVDPMDVAGARRVEKQLRNTKSEFHPQDRVRPSDHLDTEILNHEEGVRADQGSDTYEFGPNASSKLDELKIDWERWSMKRKRSLLWRIRRRLVDAIDEVDEDLIDVAADVAVGQTDFSEEELRSVGKKLRRRIGWALTAIFLTIALLLVRASTDVFESISSVFWFNPTLEKIQVESGFWYIMVGFILSLITIDRMATILGSHNQNQQAYGSWLSAKDQARHQLRPLVDNPSRLAEKCIELSQQLAEPAVTDDTQWDSKFTRIGRRLRRLTAWVVAIVLLMGVLLIVGTLIEILSGTSLLPDPDILPEDRIRYHGESLFPVIIVVGIVSWMISSWFILSRIFALKKDFPRLMQQIRPLGQDRNFQQSIDRDPTVDDDQRVSLIYSEMRKGIRRLALSSIGLIILVFVVVLPWIMRAASIGTIDTREEPWVAYLILVGIICWFIVSWFILSRYYALREDTSRLTQEINSQTKSTSGEGTPEHAGEVGLIRNSLRRLSLWSLAVVILLTGIITFWTFASIVSDTAEPQEEPWVPYLIILGILLWFVIARFMVSQVFSLRKRWFPLTQGISPIPDAGSTSSISDSSWRFDVKLNDMAGRLRKWIWLSLFLTLTMLILVAFVILTAIATASGIRDEPWIDFIVVWLIVCWGLAFRFMTNQLLVLKEDYPYFLKKVRSFRYATEFDKTDADRQTLSTDLSNIDRRIHVMARWIVVMLGLLLAVALFWLLTSVFLASFGPKEELWIIYSAVFASICWLISCWLVLSRWVILRREQQKGPETWNDWDHSNHDSIRKLRHCIKERNRLVSLDNQFDDWQAIFRALVHEPFKISGSPDEKFGRAKYDVGLSTISSRPQSFLYATTSPDTDQLHLAQSIIRDQIIRTAWLSRVFYTFRGRWERDYRNRCGHRRLISLEGDTSPPGTIRGRSVIDNEPIYAPREDFRRWMISDDTSRTQVSEELISEAFENMLNDMDYDDLLSDVVVMGFGQGMSGTSPKDFLDIFSDPVETLPLFSNTLFNHSARSAPLRLDNVAFSIPNTSTTTNSGNYTLRSTAAFGSRMRFASIRIVVSDAISPNLLSFYSRPRNSEASSYFESSASIT